MKKTEDIPKENKIFTIAEVAQSHDGSLGMAHAYIDAVSNTGVDAIKFQTHIAEAETTPQTVNTFILDLKIHDALETTLSLLRKINKYLETKAPWKSIKEDDSQRGSAATTLALSADVLRIGTQLLNPVMPEKTNTILNILGADSIPLSQTSVGLLEAGATLGEGKSPFPRIITE